MPLLTEKQRQSIGSSAHNLQHRLKKTGPGHSNPSGLAATVTIFDFMA